MSGHATSVAFKSMVRKVGIEGPARVDVHHLQAAAHTQTGQLPGDHPIEQGVLDPVAFHIHPAAPFGVSRLSITRRMNVLAPGQDHRVRGVHGRLQCHRVQPVSLYETQGLSSKAVLKAPNQWR